MQQNNLNFTKIGKKKKKKGLCQDMVSWQDQKLFFFFLSYSDQFLQATDHVALQLLVLAQGKWK